LLRRTDDDHRHPRRRRQRGTVWVHPPAPLTRLPPSVARLWRFEGGRTLWPGEAGSTGALDGGISRRRVFGTPLAPRSRPAEPDPWCLWTVVPRAAWRRCDTDARITNG